jgi:hypothetical protein
VDADPRRRRRRPSYANSTLWQVLSDDRGESFRGQPTPSKIISYDAPVLLLRLHRSALWRRPSSAEASGDPDPILLLLNNVRSVWKREQLLGGVNQPQLGVRD